MALSVLEDECSVDTVAGTIVLTTDETDSTKAFPELEGMAARNLAIQTASSMGLPDPRISGNVDVFMVDAAGDPVAGTISKRKKFTFRAAIPVTKRLA